MDLRKPIRIRLSGTERQMLAVAIRYRVLKANYLGVYAKEIMQILLNRIEGKLPKYRTAKRII